MVWSNPLGSIDTIVKAPLWFFFAAAVFFGAWSFTPTRLLTEWQVQRAPSFMLVQPIVYFAAAISLFVSSATARLSGSLGALASEIRPAILVRIASWTTDPVERATLAMFEHDCEAELHLVPVSAHIVKMRDKGLIEPTYVAPDRDWGTFRLPHHLEQVRTRNPAKFRKLFKAPQTAHAGARSSMNAALARANTRI